MVAEKLFKTLKLPEKPEPRKFLDISWIWVLQVDKKCRTIFLVLDTACSNVQVDINLPKVSRFGKFGVENQPDDLSKSMKISHPKHQKHLACFSPLSSGSELV